MERLPSELVAYIGNLIDDPRHRASCYAASKVFASVHALRESHDLRLDAQTCVEKLENLRRIIRFVRRVRPRLRDLLLMFDRCTDFSAAEFDAFEDLHGVDLRVQLMDCSCLFVKSLLSFLRERSVDVASLFLGCSPSNVVLHEDADLANGFKPSDIVFPQARAFEMYLNERQLPLLGSPALLRHVTSLTISVELHPPVGTIDLRHAGHVPTVLLVARDLAVDVECPENLTHVILHGTTGRGTFDLKPLARLREVTFLRVPMADVVHPDCSMFELLEKRVPRTALVRMLAEDGPHMVHVCRHLARKQVEVQLVYWDDGSYINSRLVQRLVPGVGCAAFDHALWKPQSGYRPPAHLTGVDDPAELYRHMGHQQRVKWCLLECARF